MRHFARTESTGLHPPSLCIPMTIGYEGPQEIVSMAMPNDRRD